MNNSDMKKIMSKYSDKRKLTPMRAIKIYCKEMCCAGDIKSWKECSFTDCPLFRLRSGRRGGFLKKPMCKSEGFSDKTKESEEYMGVEENE